MKSCEGEVVKCCEGKVVKCCEGKGVKCCEGKGVKCHVERWVGIVTLGFSVVNESKEKIPQVKSKFKVKKAWQEQHERRRRRWRYGDGGK